MELATNFGVKSSPADMSIRGIGWTQNDRPSSVKYVVIKTNFKKELLSNQPSPTAPIERPKNIPSEICFADSMFTELQGSDLLLGEEYLTQLQITN